MEAPQRILVEASVNLSGLPLGRRALVDPEAPYMAAALAAGLIFPVEEENDAAGTEASDEAISAG